MTPASEQVIERFERAWQADDPPDLSTFAAGVDPVTLREVVLLDMEYRWRRYRATTTDWLGPDLPPAVEEYARRFPRLALDDETIAEEYRARSVWGDRPTISRYAERFPDRPALPALLAEIDADVRRELVPAAPPTGLFDTPPPPEAVVVHGYTIGEVIATGATGTVFAATSAAGEPVAVKVIHPHLLSDADARNRFDREARLLLDVRHPHVVRLMAVERSGGRAAIVTEHVPGTDLGRAVRQSGPLAIADVVAVLVQAADGLAYLHARGIAHRDVSPSNIMLGNGGCVRLIDLGLAKRVVGRPEPSSPGGNSSWVTPEGNALFGTPDYVAPETVRDCTAAGTAADVYGLGGVGVFLLTGAPPFPTGTPLEKLFHHLTTPPPDLIALRPDVPRELAGLLTRCLDKDPDRRPSAAAVAEACRRTTCRAIAHSGDSFKGAASGGRPADSPQ